MTLINKSKHKKELNKMKNKERRFLTWEVGELAWKAWVMKYMAETHNVSVYKADDKKLKQVK